MEDPKTPDDPIDEASDESFPASDAPGWSGMHAGPPDGTVGSRHALNGAGTLRTIRSAFDASESAARIERAVAAAGMKVFARIDQSAEAAAVGLTMPPAIVILFGSPKGGTPLMIAKPTVAIDLPLKALVWSDTHGATFLSYNTPALLVERHGLDNDLAAKLAPAGALLEKAVRS